MRGNPGTMKLLRPASPQEAADIFAQQPDALPLAGGTDVLVSWNMGLLDGKTVLDLSRLAPWRRIETLRNGVRIGALATHTEIRENPVVRRRFPLLARACSVVGSVQIQNRGTIGGNLANASPAGDGFPPLAVYEARIHAMSAQGWRVIPVLDLFAGVKRTTLAPGELIEAVELPFPPAGRSFFRKVGSRSAQTISKAVGAGLLVQRKGLVEDLRVAFGSVAPVVRRLRAVEGFLKGKRLSPETVERSCELLREDVSPIDDIRSTREYRLKVCENILRDFLGGRE